MATLRSLTTALWSRGVPGVSSSDPAGAWQLERGLRAELQRRPGRTDEPR